MKKITLLGILIFSFGLLQASALEKIEAKESKYDTVQIQTSAICGDCKERIEHDMSFEKGVKSVELDNETKIVTIVYRKEKTDKEKLKLAITKIGYDADEMPADEKAYEKLPACCKRDVAPH
jgi:copper chaperone CopZ